MNMDLMPNEWELVGKWIFENNKVHGNETCERIGWLTEYALEKLAISSTYGAWETLFRDPSDGRLWELTYPQGEMHGGGAPLLKVLPMEEAKTKYDFKESKESKGQTR